MFNLLDFGIFEQSLCPLPITCRIYWGKNGKNFEHLKCFACGSVFGGIQSIIWRKPTFVTMQEQEIKEVRVSLVIIISYLSDALLWTWCFRSTDQHQLQILFDFK